MSICSDSIIETRLDKVATFEMGQAPPGVECNKNGIGTLFVKAGEFGQLYPVEREWTTKPLKYGRNGDVFICVVGATCGKLNLGIDCSIGRSVAAIRPNPGIETKFLYYQLLPWVERIRKSASGSAQGVITRKDLADIPVVSTNSEEQKKIVAEIEKQFSRLDEAVASLKQIQANLKRYKAAVLKAAVDGKLTEQWRKEHPDVEPAEQLLKRILAERRAKWEAEEMEKMKEKGKKPKDDSWKKKYKEPVGPDKANLPELPEGWVWARAEQFCDFITKGTTPSANKLHEDGGAIRFLKVYNLTFNGRLNYNYKASFVDQSVHQEELARSKVFAGDVLINIVGPPLGQVSVVPSEITEANINQAIARFRPLNGVLNRFLAITLMTESVMSWAIKRAKTTAGQSNLTLELCRDLPIPLPSLAEQNQVNDEIDRRLSVTEELEATIETNLKRAERLRQTILGHSFFG